MHSVRQGYPFFLQEYGKAVWNIAECSPITVADAREARDVVDWTRTSSLCA